MSTGAVNSSEALIQPFAALMPNPTMAINMIAPPYDIVDKAQALALSSGKPQSFLHLTRPDIHYPDGTSNAVLFEDAGKRLAQWIEAGFLSQSAKNTLYVYQMQQGDHIQTGLMAACSVEAYREKRIRIHEKTRPEKEADRVQHLLALKAQLSPVLLSYLPNKEIHAIIEKETQHKPVLDLLHYDGVVHRVWAIEDAATVNQLVGLFDAMDAIYVADGHHRSAAAEQVARQYPDNSKARYFLAALFPSDELVILGYHRLLKDLNGLMPDELLSRLEKEGRLTRIEAGQIPTVQNNFTIYLDKKWYSLVLNNIATDLSPTERLSVSLLSQRVLKPILNIQDERTDKRIDFVGGAQALTALKQRVDELGTGCGIWVCPTTMPELLAVANVNACMPPKSTWFEPKLADGLLSFML